jgi:orotate phosphoribosyltransferase
MGRDCSAVPAHIYICIVFMYIATRKVTKKGTVMESDKGPSWETIFKESGAWWVHDGHENRPYARLTSGLISNQYIDMSRIITRPTMVQQATRYLADQLWDYLNRRSIDIESIVLVGQMKGSVTIASRIAEEFDAGFIWLDKSNDSVNKSMVVDGRFDLSWFAGCTFIMVEDVLSTGSTSIKSQATLRKAGVHVEDLILTVVNRSGMNHIGNNQIMSCIDISMQSWKHGENPFTPDGKEPVRPVRPKGPRGYLLREVL